MLRVKDSSAEHPLLVLMMRLAKLFSGKEGMKHEETQPGTLDDAERKLSRLCSGDDSLNTTICTCCRETLATESQKGKVPVSSWYMSMPRLHMSAWASYS